MISYLLDLGRGQEVKVLVACLKGEFIGHAIERHRLWREKVKMYGTIN